MTSGPVEREGGRQPNTKVFISYSRKDTAFADRLDAALKARGFEPLIDRTDIYAFEEWWKRVETLLGSADTVVFVLSPDAVRPGTVALKEVEFAASLNKRFAPVVWHRVDDKLIPEPLAKLNFIFFDDEMQFEQRVDQLAEALRTDIGWIRQHTDFGEQARRWAQAKGATGLLLRSPVLEEAERWIASRPPGAPTPTDQTQSFIRHSRQGATRRRNVLTGSLAAGLVLALALAGLAYWQRGAAVEQRSIAQQNEAQAKTERDNATRNFKLAQKTAESLVADIAEGLRDVQGMRAETVRKILETARMTFEQLAASASDDLSLQRSRAVMLDTFGNTYRTLGDLDAALRVYRDARAIFEHLVNIDRSNTQWQRDLSISYEYVGGVSEAQGKLDDALSAYRDSLAIIARLIEIEPSNSLWQRHISVSYNKVGSILVVQDKRDEALDAYRNSLAIRERLVAAEPNNADWQHDLLASYHNVGDVLEMQGKFDEALKVYQDAVAVAKRLAGADPGNTLWQRDLSVSYGNIGNMMKHQGKLDEAIEAYRNGIAINERLVAADRSNTEWQRDLSIFYNHVGEVLEAQGKLDDALKAYRDGISIRERLVAIDRNNAKWQRDLSYSDNKIGDVLVAQGKLDEALQVYTEAFAIVKRLAATNSNNTRWQRALALCHGNLAFNTQWKNELAWYEQQIDRLQGQRK